MRLAISAVLFVLLAACAQPPATTDVPGIGREGIPDDAPSICGIITALTPDEQVLVEEDPRAEYGSAKAMVRLQESTRVLRRDGVKADPSALIVGQTVSAWFDGPVAESYPVQAAAGVVVIEPATTCG